MSRQRSAGVLPFLAAAAVGGGAAAAGSCRAHAKAAGAWLWVWRQLGPPHCLCTMHAPALLPPASPTHRQGRRGPAQLPALQHQRPPHGIIMGVYQQLSLLPREGAHGQQKLCLGECRGPKWVGLEACVPAAADTPPRLAASNPARPPAAIPELLTHPAHLPC